MDGYGFLDIWIETDVATVQHASCNANDWRNRAGVVLDQLSNFLNGNIPRFTIGEPLVHVNSLLLSPLISSLSSLSPPISPSISLFLFLSVELVLWSWWCAVVCVDSALALSLFPSPSRSHAPVCLRVGPHV